jgi:hypothetical protein
MDREDISKVLEYCSNNYNKIKKVPLYIRSGSFLELDDKKIYICNVCKNDLENMSSALSKYHLSIYGEFKGDLRYNYIVISNRFNILKMKISNLIINLIFILIILIILGVFLAPDIIRYIFIIKHL